MIPEATTVDPCPSDEQLTAFVERRLSGERLLKVERHVSACTTCLDAVAACLPEARDAVLASIRSDEEPATAVAGRTRDWRALAIAASVVLTLGASLFAMRERYLGPPLARLGSRVLGVPLQARSVDFRLGSDPRTVIVALQNVVIGRVGRRYRADEVSLTMALAAPLTSEPPVQYVRVTRPTVDLVGRDPADMLVSRGERGKAIDLLAQANRVDVEDARILFAGPDGTTIAIDGITGGVERTDQGAKLVFSGQVAGGQIDLTGTVTGHERDVSFTIGGRGLDASGLPILRAGLRGMVDVRLDVTTSGGDVRVDGRVSVRDGQLLGHGAATLTRLSAESRAALTVRDATLGGVDLPFDDARAIFAWRSGSWRVSRAYLASHGAIAGGRARVSKHGDVRGHGTLRLPSELVADLDPFEPTLAGFHDAGGTATLPFVVTGPVRNPAIVVRKP